MFHVGETKEEQAERHRKEFSKMVNSLSDRELEKRFKNKFDAMKSEGKMA